MENVKDAIYYTGSKYRIIDLIKQNLPQNFTTFIDVFGGGGSVCMNIETDRIIYNEKDKHVYDLIHTIKTNDISEIIDRVEFYVNYFKLSKTNKQGYLEFRKKFNESQHNLPKFTKNIVLLTLIYHSFNHFMTFNKEGNFTTPSGYNRHYFNKATKQRLIDFKERLNFLFPKIEMYNFDFRDLCGRIKFSNIDIKNAVFFFDPPYLMSDSQYNRTHGNSWNEQDEQDLYNICNEIDKLGGKFMLTNLVKSKGKSNNLLLDFSKKYRTINTNVDFDGCSYQRKNKKTDREIMVINY